VKEMLNDSVLEKIFLHPEMHKIPIGTQATAVHVFDDVLEQIVKENQYADVQSLLSTTANVSK
jgi:hypothetical protein